MVVVVVVKVAVAVLVKVWLWRFRQIEKGWRQRGARLTRQGQAMAGRDDAGED